MNRTVLSLALGAFASLSIVACAADPSPPEEEVEAEPVMTTTTEAQRIGLDPTKYCPPGEKVYCTLGPPPVCRCVPTAAGLVEVSR